MTPPSPYPSSTALKKLHIEVCQLTYSISQSKAKSDGRETAKVNIPGLEGQSSTAQKIYFI